MPGYDDDDEDDGSDERFYCAICEESGWEDDMRESYIDGEHFCWNENCSIGCSNCDLAYPVDALSSNSRLCPGCVASEYHLENGRERVLDNCNNCDRPTAYIGLERYRMSDGQDWCRPCAIAASSVCSTCRSRHRRNGNNMITTQNGYRYCISCSSNRAWQCSCSAYVDRSTYCNICYIFQDGRAFRCGCRGGTQESPVHQSSCRPKLQFHGESTSNLFFGIELETQIRGSDELYAASLFAMGALQGDEIAQLKYDGSIGSGFEIVTQPATFETYMNGPFDKLWATIDVLRIKHRARSWDAGSCGLHIHISRKGFTDTAHTHRFIELIYRQAEMMMKFSGRKSSYAKFNDCWRTNAFDVPAFSIEHKIPADPRSRGNGDRYTAVNTNNEHTLELRFMRGTMNVDGVKSGISLAHALVEYTRAVHEDKHGEWYDWENFDSYVKAHAAIYPELVKRLPHIKDVDINSKETIDA